MKKSKQAKSKLSAPLFASLSLGEFAGAILQEQYHKFVAEEKKVLADKDPEHLHHMRVSSRRLRTALQVFGRAIAVPKAASAKRIGSLAKTLGHLRDLDVQIATLQETYRSQLPKAEQTQLDAVVQSLQHQRRRVFTTTETALTRSRYRHLKAAYDDWFAQPTYTELAHLPLLLLLPDLLSPLLSELLLHPGWLVPGDLSQAGNETLHSLRKVCKHVRYQAEFFADCYGAPFQEWIDEIKMLQSELGKVQDTQVLQALLAQHLPPHTQLPHLQAAVQQSQQTVLVGWETTRQKYLEPSYRDHLHHLLLQSRLTGDLPPPINGAEPETVKTLSLT